ncbi:hypothetical protein AMATHDRAFT_64397 [Amanita thiersii Skay4041]|uniref:Condensin complex subunit 1 n=1 Tax=Amanita thiersii Skay4041 TaxID=703135 RepID=A0A2A9NKN7_9AGAR|nr:hypothetical protein AMATHDRAFT_64397 [Amanita thiersii Skay4041]
MRLPFELQDELQALADVQSYDIPNEHDPESEDVQKLLEGAVESVAESSDAIADQEVFDVYRSLLKHVDSIPGVIMSKLLDSISSGFLSELEATMRDIDSGDQQAYMSHKQPLELFAFLLHWFVSTVEKVKQLEGEDAPVVAAKPRRGRGGKAGAGRAAGRAAANRRKETFTWIDQIPATLGLICKVLRLQTQRIWTTTAERDTFVNCLTRLAHHVSENEQYMKIQDIRLGVYKVICLAVKHHGQGMATQIVIMQNLQFYEHLSEPMAECLSVLVKEFDHAQLGDEILREIAGKDFSSADKNARAAQDSKGPRSIARFLVKFAELSPRSILKQLSLLLGQLDSESWPIRTSLVEVVGYLITELAAPVTSTDTDARQVQKQIANLYDLLLERMLDVSSYVRTKVLSVLSKLCDLKVKFPKQRLAITRAAVTALEDKAATVRKNAAALLVKLLLTHPYGLMHGGMLALDTWKAEYKVVKEQLQKVEGTIGNAVERPQGEEDDEEGEEEEDVDKDSDECGEDEDGGDEEEQDEDEDEDDVMDSTPKQSKKSKKKRPKSRHEDAMDVDGEEEENSGMEDGGDTEDAMDEDGEENEEGTSKRHSKKSRNKKASKLKPRKSQLDVAAVSNEQAALAALESNQLLHLRLRKKYYAEALSFIRQIEAAMEVIAQLLGSTNKPEVLESMEFFRVAHEYQFETAQIGIKRMLHLIWHKDNNSSTTEDGKELKGIRSRVLECYRSLYFDPIPDLDPKAQVNRIAKNMIELTYDATLAELTSLEEMMRIMMDEGHVHPDVISKLWQVYSAQRNLPKAQRRGAIIILGMLALAKRSVLADHVDVMLKMGLGHLGNADLTLARYTCVALQRLNGSAKKIKGSLLDKTLRIEMDNSIFRKLQEAIEHPCRSREWFGLAEQIINTVYALGEHPDAFCNDLIKKLTVRAFSKPQEKPVPDTDTGATAEEKDPDAMDEDGQSDGMEADENEQAPSQNPSTQEEKDVGDAFELSQLLFVVGHVAIKHIVYLELVERELKRQKDEKQAAEKRSAPNQNTKDKEGEELDQVAGNAEDEIGDRMSAIRETELLYGPESLLSLYGPIIVHICGSPHKFKNRTLRGAATLAFSKFLCVSSQFCDQHHRLLFKILETSKDPNIRSNIVIALGDVAVSFSNIIDENSNELYKGLSDKNLVVKKNTLMVLTHLILNGMIKVKGQLGEMAKCLEDEEPRIADLAKLFFDELSTKDNAIYNNLPDVISHLSTGEHAVDEETFQSTLRYIFKFIEKEKQAENIVEKLCQRFRLTEDPRQWRDIAYCLSLLPYKSEKSVKKLIEGLQFYRDKLHEPVVFDRFTEILTKARANRSKDKPDSELNEFEQILEEHKRQGEEDQALERRVEGKRAAAKKRATKRSKRKERANSDDEA